MGVFNPSPKGNKITVQEYINRYGLAELSQQEVIHKIAKDMAESGLTKESLSSKSNLQLEAQVLYLDTIVEQNWLILKQLEKLNSK